MTRPEKNTDLKISNKHLQEGMANASLCHVPMCAHMGGIAVLNTKSAIKALNRVSFFSSTIQWWAACGPSGAGFSLLGTATCVVRRHSIAVEAADSQPKEDHAMSVIHHKTPNFFDSLVVIATIPLSLYCIYYILSMMPQALFVLLAAVAS